MIIGPEQRIREGGLEEESQEANDWFLAELSSPDVPSMSRMDWFWFSLMMIGIAMLTILFA